MGSPKRCEQENKKVKLSGSGYCSSPESFIDHAHHVSVRALTLNVMIEVHPNTIVDAKDLHTLVIVEGREEFGRDEEVLSAIRGTGD